MDIQNNEKRIYFNFTYYAMKLLGKNLYSNPWTAISELVANGIDAHAPYVYVLIDMRNKQHSTVEVFDNGSGMTYEDLCDKYALIGRNKRENEPEDKKDTILGRKGIGKLAALFLSKKYFLCTKTKGSTTTWVVDSTAFKDSDIPTLNRIENTAVSFESEKEWGSFAAGTMIKLSNVDLRNIGEERIKSLNSIIADYYLVDSISSKIKVAVIQANSDSIDFKEVSKNLSFTTMLGLFNNLTADKKLLDAVYINADGDIPKEIEHKVNTTNFDPEKYITSGEVSLKDNNGNEAKVPYNLNGWIGIHCSLDEDIQCRNNPNYKKLQYRTNSIRLYVRGKLAVANLMHYIGSSQAFATYIEGEISFDVLDDDRFEDISTSNREGYNLNDPRVQKLLEITKKIVTSLISLRATAGNAINLEVKEYNKKKEEEERARREEEEQKRKEAEEKARKAELERDAAKDKANDAKKQCFFLQSQLTDDVKARAYNTHVIKNNAGAINDNILTLIKEHSETKKYKEVQKIALAGGKILTAVKYYSKAAYDFVNKKIEGNITIFISDYIVGVASKQYDKIKCDVQENVNCKTVFPPQDITVMIENIFSNAEKAGAKNIKIIYQIADEKLIIKFINDGDKLPKGVEVSELFEFGFSKSGSKGATSAVGTGVGLFQIKDVICRLMKGEVEIYDNEDKGITLEVKIKCE